MLMAACLAACTGGSKPSADTASSLSNGARSSDISTGTSQSNPENLVLDMPVGVTPCRSSDLQFASGGGNPGEVPLLRLFNRSDRSCGLAGYVTVFGEDPAGEWQLVPTTNYPHASVSASSWTGVFDPNLVAVLRIRTDDASCTGTATPVHYSALRLVLPGDAGAIDIPGLAFDSGRCPLLVTPITGDSQDP